jgi:hypothetical protein
MEEKKRAEYKPSQGTGAVTRDHIVLQKALSRRVFSSGAKDLARIASNCLFRAIRRDPSLRLKLGCVRDVNM